MALTFGTKNQRIRENMKHRFMISPVRGEGQFHWHYINNSNYVTGVYFWEGSRPNMSIYANNNSVYQNWNPPSDSNCLAYSQWAHNSTNYFPNIGSGSATSPTTGSSIMLDVNKTNIYLKPQWFKAALNYWDSSMRGRNTGYITHFTLVHRYSSTVYGMMCGSVGLVGSGADLEIEIYYGGSPSSSYNEFTHDGGTKRTDTYVNGSSYYIYVPRGLRIYPPQPPQEQ